MPHKIKKCDKIRRYDISKPIHTSRSTPDQSIEYYAKRVQKEYPISDLEAAQVVRLERWARQAPRDMAGYIARLHEDAEDQKWPCKPTAERVIGLCHLLDNYCASLNSHLMHWEPNIPIYREDVGTEIEVGKKHVIAKQAKRVFQVADLFNENLPSYLMGGTSYRVFTPIGIEFKDGKAVKVPNYDIMLFAALAEIFSSAWIARAQTDSDLARVALTKCDNTVRDLIPECKWPKLLRRAAKDAYKEVYDHFEFCEFTPGFGKAIMQHKLPTIYVLELGLFPTVLRNAMSQAMDYYPPFERTIALAWAAQAYANNATEARIQLEMAKKTMLKNGFVTKDEIRRLTEIVEKNEGHIDRQLSASTLCPSEIIKDQKE